MTLAPAAAALARAPLGGLATRFLLFLAVLAAVLFLAAGRLDWGRGWALVVLFVLMVAVNAPLVLHCNPELLRERFKRRTDTKRFDRVFGLVHTAAVLALLVVGGLDGGRYGWTGTSPALAWVGVGLFALGDGPLLWALCTNPYLEATVRIQRDRGQRVITTGPYRFVRHPMYVGGILLIASWPLVLGSLWAFVPVAVDVAALAVRTALEDRTLQRELPGYAEYARRTRFRLVPGLW
jgi:protein-S-isoprenylcysteine O-methyltransferase Ste14